MINSIGGVQVLFPLLEQLGLSNNEGGATDLLTPLTAESPHGSIDEWEIIPKPSALGMPNEMFNYLIYYME